MQEKDSAVREHELGMVPEPVAVKKIKQSTFCGLTSHSLSSFTVIVEVEVVSGR